MAYSLTTGSHGSTGVKTVTVGFQPYRAKITVSAVVGGDTNAQESVGTTDGTLEICNAWYQDATRGKQNRFTNRMVNVYDWNGAAFVDKVVATFDSFTATEFKYNVTTADSNYQFMIEVWG